MTMDRNLTAHETVAVATHLMSSPPPNAKTIRLGLLACLRQSPNKLRDDPVGGALLGVLRQFLEIGGEIHIVTGGENPGKVLAIELDAKTDNDCGPDSAGA